MTTPGITSPCSSATFPTIDPTISWEKAGAVARVSNEPSATTLTTLLELAQWFI